MFLKFIQALLPGAPVAISDIQKDPSESSKSSDNKDKVYAHQMVRTDDKIQKLDAFLPKVSVQQSTVIDTSVNRTDDARMEVSSEGGKDKGEERNEQPSTSSR